MKINSFDDIIERIREDLRRGATSREIAKKYRLSLRDVQRIRRLEGFSISKYELLKQEAEELEAEIERKTKLKEELEQQILSCLLYTSPSPRDGLLSRMPSSA